MSTTSPLSRRAFLSGRSRGRRAPPRPPWSVAEARFTAACTRCDACLAACPERILVRGDGGYPEVDFRRGACTFCGDCARACPEPLFADPETTAVPWRLQARVGTACLGHAGVVCELCRDACAPRALQFLAAGRRRTVPALDAARCTGCGACVAVCPTGAVTVRPPEPAALAHG
jgi:ferredoxin-type protein NapF